MNEKLQAHIEEHPYPLLFVTLSGDHLYGFASEDSNWDLRGVHMLSVTNLISLNDPEESITTLYERDGLEIDLVTHDVKKFINLMLKPNGYVLEQLFSPHVLLTSPEHEELIALGKRCVIKDHAKHYLDFANGEWKRFQKEDVPKVKTLLYVYRVLLTGIHLMRTGVIEANLQHLNEDFQLPYLPDLMKLNKEGHDKDGLDNADLLFHESAYRRLTDTLVAECDRTTLPDQSDAREELNQLLIRLRLNHMGV